MIRSPAAGSVCKQVVEKFVFYDKRPFIFKPCINTQTELIVQQTYILEKLLAVKVGQVHKLLWFTIPHLVANSA